MKKQKSILAWMLTLAMVMSLLSGAVFAVEQPEDEKLPEEIITGSEQLDKDKDPEQEQEEELGKEEPGEQDEDEKLEDEKLEDEKLEDEKLEDEKLEDEKLEQDKDQGANGIQKTSVQVLAEDPIITLDLSGLVQYQTGEHWKACLRVYDTDGKKIGDDKWNDSISNPLKLPVGTMSATVYFRASKDYVNMLQFYQDEKFVTSYFQDTNTQYTISLYFGKIEEDTTFAVTGGTLNYTVQFNSGDYSFVDSFKYETNYSADVSLKPNPKSIPTAQDFQNLPAHWELTGWKVGTIVYSLDDMQKWAEKELTSNMTFSPVFDLNPNFETQETEAVINFDENQNTVSVDNFDDTRLLVKQGPEEQVILRDGATLNLSGTISDFGGKAVTIGKDISIAIVSDKLTMNSKNSSSCGMWLENGAEVVWTLMDEAELETYTNGIRLNGNAKLTLTGAGSLKTSSVAQSNSAISVPEEATLLIENTEVTAKGGAAGIGSDNSESKAGTIIIDNAKVTAFGGNNSAGIGGGINSNGGTTVIKAGSVVYAEAGGGYNGSVAGIGGGEGSGDKGGKAGNITIEAGATVTAIGKTGGAGIGRGLTNKNNKRVPVEDPTGSITIKDGANVTAYASGHNNESDIFLFAIDTGIENNISVSLLNARFDLKALDRILTVNETHDITVLGGEKEIALSLQASVYAFATTVSGAGQYMVAFNKEGREADRAEYDLVDGDTQFIFSVADKAMLTRDKLKFTHFTINATAGNNGSISNAGETAIAPLGNQTYFFTPNSGYAVDQVTVNEAPVTITNNSYTFNNVLADATIHVTFRYVGGSTDPDPDPTPDPVTHTVSVRYINENGVSIRSPYSVGVRNGASYDVSVQTAIEIEGYSIDRVEGTVSGTATGNVEIVVHYVSDSTITDPDTPLGEKPDGTTGGNNGNGSGDAGTEDDVVIIDPSVPLGNLPKTGTAAVAGTLPSLAVAVTAGCAALVLGRKKEEDQE